MKRLTLVLEDLVPTSTMWRTRLQTREFAKSFSLSADSEHFGATLGARTLRGRLSVLQLDFLRILHLDGLLALHTVCFDQVHHQSCIVLH